MAGIGLSHELWILHEQPSDGLYQYEVNFPYLSKDHVYVYVGENGALRDYFWIGNNRIQVELFDTETELPLGSEVYIVRRTPIHKTLVDYQGGQILSSEDLDVSYLQILYILQEVFEGIQISGMTYRPIDVDKHTVLEMLEGELTKSHLFQALIDELDLISVLHGGQSDLYDSVTELFSNQGILQGSVADINITVEDHGSSIDLISATINEQSTNIAAIELSTDDNTAQINTTVGRLDLEEQRGVVIEERLWVGEEGDNGLIDDPSPNSLMGQYTVKMQLDANGEHRVSGFGLSMEEAIDTNNLMSEFMILADRFRIVSPDQTNALSSTTVFTVGQVNGDYKCGIRGDLIVENSIDSRSLRTNDITLEHFSTTTQEAIKNTEQRWDHISDLPDYQIVGSQTLISPGAILLANGTSTLDELTADHVVESFSRKWAAESGADNTQTRLTSGADISDARANGKTLIQGGYLNTDILQVGTAEIQDLSVQTIKIANNAVTMPKYQEDIGHSVAGTSAWVTSCFYYLEMNEPGLIMAWGTVIQSFPSGAQQWQAKLRIADTEVTYTQGSANMNTEAALMGSLAVPAGTHVVAMYWWGNSNILYHGGRLAAQGVKK